jgi:hypothetical protein
VNVIKTNPRSLDLHAFCIDVARAGGSNANDTEAMKVAVKKTDAFAKVVADDERRSNKAEGMVDPSSPIASIPLTGTMVVSFKYRKAPEVAVSSSVVAVEADLLLLAQDNPAALAQSVTELEVCRIELKINGQVYDLSDGTKYPVRAWASNPDFWTIRVPGVGGKKLKVSSPNTMGTGSSFVAITADRKVFGGVIIRAVGDVSMSVLGGAATHTFKNVFTHNGTTQDGNCGSLLIQGASQCTASHIGRGIDPITRDPVNFAVSLN